FFPHSGKVCDDEILPLVEQTLYRENPRVWYWALMDLGSALKNTVANPNRRSAHHIIQSSFEGSDRKIRGNILKILLKAHFLEEEELFIRLDEDPDRIMSILKNLKEEGFIQRIGNGYQLK
ncbi:MAG: A/G-specific adenine glycosylase, partial [Methanoregula sp.]|nr:A/G-specific adenine glycosylase [Methanoregula sp.]